MRSPNIHARNLLDTPSRQIAFFFLFVACAAAGCGGSTPPPLTTKPQTTVGAAAKSTPSDEGRWHHFWIVRQAVDAIMKGEVNTTQNLLRRMADGDFGEQIRPDWSVWVEEMQDEAVIAGRTRGLRSIAEQVAAIAARCGDCHRSAKPGPGKLSLSRLEQMAHGSSGAEPTNSTHRWAANELWIGMTIPQHQAWARGAQALISSPLHRPAGPEGATDDANPTQSPAPTSTPAPGSVDLLDAAAAVQVEARVPTGARGMEDLAHVGARLLNAGQPLPMAKAYADYISRCGSCHTGH